MAITESPAIFPMWVWIGVFAIAGSAPGWLGDAVWSPRTGAIAVLACGCVAIVYRVVRHKRDGAVNSAAVALLKASGIGLFAWLFSLVAWLALEIGLGGRVQLMIEALAGLVSGGLAGGVAYWFAHRRPGIWAERCRKIVLGGAAIGTLVLATLYVLFTGPHDLDRYPPAASSPYRLPWTGGVMRLCIQGNRAIVSHRDWEEFAYDFAMPVGSDGRLRKSRGRGVECDPEEASQELSMPSKNEERVLQFVDKLLVEADALMRHRPLDRWMTFVANCRLLAEMLGDAGKPWKPILNNNHPQGETALLVLNGTLVAIRDAIANDLLHRLEDFVNAETFDDLLEQADYLFNRSYFMAAGVLGRAVLEERLRKWCHRAGILPTKPHPTINDYNQAIYLANLYDKITMKHVDAMAAVGNDAAHGKKAEKDDIERLLRDVRDFLARHPMS